MDSKTYSEMSTEERILSLLGNIYRGEPYEVVKTDLALQRMILAEEKYKKESVSEEEILSAWLDFVNKYFPKEKKSLS